jgi:hypothetical protein
MTAPRNALTSLSERFADKRSRHLITLLLYSLPLLLAYLVYSYVITLPFFLDDGPHFFILNQTTGFEFWGDFPSFPFYRPFDFTIWKLFEIVTGGFDPVALHWLNIACFGLAGVILGQLARRMAPYKIRMTAAIIAGVMA